MIDNKRFAYSLISIFLMIAFVTIAGVQAQPSDISSLKAKAAVKGHVNVIVGLNLSGGFTPEGRLHGNEIAQQRKAIADTRKALKDSLGGLHAKVYREWDTVHAVALKVDASALNYLANSPLVTTIHEDLISYPAGTVYRTLIGSDATWGAGIGGRGQTVVFLDSGIDANHPFFGGRVVAQACFSNAGGDGGGVALCPNGTDSQTGNDAADVTIGQTADMDHCDTNGNNLCWHGTAVAGVAAGNRSDTLGWSGVAPEANIIAIQVFTRYNDDTSCDGPGSAPCVKSFTSDQISALEWVYSDSVRLTWHISSVNMSLGTQGMRITSACDDQPIKTAIDNLLSYDIATCIASGNDGYTDAVSFPACVSTAVTIGAVSASDRPPADSVYYNISPLVDLMAVGRCVASSAPVDTWLTCSGGTSFSSPQVTGAFAVIKSIEPTKSIEDILSLLQTTGVSVTDNRPSCATCTGTGTTKPRLQLDAAVPITYTIKDLGTLGGCCSQALGINNVGQVVGTATLIDGTYHAFLYNGGTMTDLGTLGGSPPDHYSWAFGINDVGQVAGTAIMPDHLPHAFLYKGGTMHDLGTLGGTNSYGQGINNAGQVVGYSYYGPTNDKTHIHAFLYDGTIMHDLGTLGGISSNALDINDVGQVVGSSTLIPGGPGHAFLYKDGTMTDIGRILSDGYSSSEGEGINNSGQVAGIAVIPGQFPYPFLYSDGAMTNLGTFGGNYNVALDINNTGQVVGWSNYTNGDTDYHVFLYSGDTMYDLNNMIPLSSGWESLTIPSAQFIQEKINDGGQIVGGGMINGFPHAYLLTPALDTASGINVTVSPPGSGTSVTFPNVSSRGYTSATISNNCPTSPAGFELLGNCYDVTTSAIYNGQVTVCITDPAVTASSQLLHYESGQWVPVTVPPVIPPTICGSVSSLSDFGIAQALPPVAVCQNVTAAAGSNCTASASINNGSYDPRGGSVTLTQSPAGPYPLGNTQVTLTATDSYGTASQCTGMVTVNDKTPPSITGASANPSSLWPPNLTMVNVTINYSAMDNCGQPACQISRVTCNESITNSDYAIVDAHHVKLSANRLDSGHGRIYTMTVTCTDTSGNSSNKLVTVTVPHDLRK